MFRLKMILRQLQISSFGGKMNALNEVNRVITSVSYYPQPSATSTQGPVIGGNNQVMNWNIRGTLIFQRQGFDWFITQRFFLEN